MYGICPYQMALLVGRLDLHDLVASSSEVGGICPGRKAGVRTNCLSNINRIGALLCHSNLTTTQTNRMVLGDEAKLFYCEHLLCLY